MLIYLKLKHLPMASPTGLARNPSNLDETILLGSPLKAENLTDALKLGMIPTARAYTPPPSSKITHYNPNHYGVGPIEAALSPQSYVSPQSDVSPQYLYYLGGRKKSRRKLKRKKRKTKRRKNKRKSRRRKVNKNKRKSRRRK